MDGLLYHSHKRKTSRQRVHTKIMKRVIIFLVAIAACSLSCQHNDSISPVNSSVTFSFTSAVRNSGRVKETSDPAFVLLSVKGGNGQERDNLKLRLHPFGQSLISESLVLQTGAYQLTQFFVLDSAENVIYAAPVSGSALASDSSNPLPMKFEVGSGSVQIVPQVLAVAITDLPENFGYTSFGFEPVSMEENVLIKSAVVMKIGNVIYENLDATICVKGYDSLNAQQWIRNFDFTGPSQILDVKFKFHHYSIELVNKWGINDVQSNISAEEIWKGRANGPKPVTYVLGGAKAARKMTMYVTSMEKNASGQGSVYQPQNRALFTYDQNGRLQSIRYEGYDTNTQQFTEDHTETFIFSDSLLTKITTTINGLLQKEDLYTYGQQNGITETLYNNNNLVWTQTSTIDHNTGIVSANYSLSNGNSFSYRFTVVYKNMIDDATDRPSEHCADGVYTYDKNINPFRHLGYVDFNFLNWSINNRLTEKVHYVACGFPTLVPVSYDYTYDSEGYPLQKITTYRAGSLDGEGSLENLPNHSRTEFFYK